MYSAPQLPRNIKKFMPGAIISSEGDTSAEMYVLLDGNAGVFKNYRKENQQEIEMLGPSKFFGEASLFLNRPKPASLVAINEVTVMCIDRTNVLNIFAKQPEMPYAIVGELCRRLDAIAINAAAVQANPAARQTISAPARTEANTGARPAPQQAVKPAPEAKPVSEEKPVPEAPSQSSRLFPPEHGSYVLPVPIVNDTYLFEQKLKCPLCSQEFEHLTALGSRLRRVGTDRDMRVRYVDVEPMYYDVASCPYCLYSASLDLFPTASKRNAERVAGELGEYRGDVVIKTGKARDTFTVFAGYYLAFKCIPLCFDEYQLTTAGLWQKLSRLYKDCDDEKMYLYASEQAIKDYEFVYGHFHISDKQSQQICFILGDLYERLGNYTRAQENFFRVKSMKEGTPAFKLQADKRLEELKEIIRNEKKKQEKQS